MPGGPDRAVAPGDATGMGGAERPAGAAADAAAPPAWRWVLLGLLTVLLVPALPMLPVLVPIAQPAVLLVPAVAACALVAWWRGGRLAPALVWVAVAAWVVAQPIPGGGGYGLLVRGWALVVAGVFGLLCLLRPGRGFLDQALPALALALCLAAAALLAHEGPLGSQLGAVAGAEYAQRAAASAAWLRQGLASPEWAQFAARYPEFVQTVREQQEAHFAALPERSLRVLPAMLALQSLALLALGWALYQRLGRTRVGPPLGALRHFRFNDQLIWGLIVAITLLVVPGFGELGGVAMNLLVFFGALYVVRGVGVLSWLFAARRWTRVLLAVLAVPAWQLLAPFALAIGVGDTWLDWRNRPRPTS